MVDPEYVLLEGYVKVVQDYVGVVSNEPCPHCGRVNCGQQVLPFDQDEENAGDN